MESIYFDNAATTKLDPEVLEVMLPWLSENYGNASSIHKLGQLANVAVEEAREKIAHILGAEPAEIIFTSGGTESDNAVVHGVLDKSAKNKVITSNVEHHAILHPVEQLDKIAFKSIIIPADESGRISAQQLESHLDSNTALVSLMHINNEIGTINDIKHLAEIAHSFGSYFHSDMVQSIGKLALNVKDLDIDFLSISAHKIHGPKGVGLLYAKAGTEWSPFQLGGSQERKRRAGTLNVPGIIGFAKAMELADKNLEENTKYLSELKAYFEDQLKQSFSEVIQFNHPLENCSPHILNVSFPFSDQNYLDGEMLLLNMDIEGVCCSSGSACTSGAIEPSHVLLALGIQAEVAKSSIRFSLSKYNTKQEVDHTVNALSKIIHRMRK